MKVFNLICYSVKLLVVVKLFVVVIRIEVGRVIVMVFRFMISVMI